MANQSDLSPAGSSNSDTDTCIVVWNDKMHQSGPTPPPPGMVLHHETSHMSEANVFFVVFFSLNALTYCSCSFHTKSCICTSRSFLLLLLLFSPSFAELLCDLFSVSEKPNYGHWVMSEQMILWDQHCLCQSYRKHKWPADRGTKRFLTIFFYYIYYNFIIFSHYCYVYIY